MSSSVRKLISTSTWVNPAAGPPEVFVLKYLATENIVASSDHENLLKS